MNNLRDTIELHAKNDLKGYFKYKDEHLPYLIYVETNWDYNSDTYNWELRIFNDISSVKVLKISSLEYSEDRAKHIACKELERYTRKIVYELKEDYDADVIKKVELLIVRKVISKYEFPFLLLQPKEWVDKINRACDRKRKSLLGAKGEKGWVQENIKGVNNDRKYYY